MKELDIKRYGGDIPILPLNTTVEIYKYSDAILKLLKTTQNDLLYSNKKVCQLVEHGENITRPKMLTQLTKQMTILMIDLTFRSGSFVI